MEGPPEVVSLPVGLHGSVWRSVMLTIACLLHTVTGCSQAPSSTHQQVVPASVEKGTTVAEHVLRCPPAGSHASATLKGHHRVTLTWNASRGKNVVGYCLYRSTQKKVAKNKPNTEFACAGCEQVNAIPIVPTGCVDDLVRDNSSYFYVATALDHDKWLSGASNEVRADIPGESSSSTSQASPYGRCREDSTSK